MRIKNFDTIENIYKNEAGAYMMESKDIAEVLYLIKYLGNYNINKINNVFIIENEKHAVVLEKV